MHGICIAAMHMYKGHTLLFVEERENEKEGETEETREWRQLLKK